LIVIAGCSRKGGAGKTTLIAHLAVAAEAAKVGTVGLVDLDPMQGLARWWDARQNDSLLIARADPDLPAALRALEAAGCVLVLIDTPPSVGSVVAEAIAAADLVVVPCQPSPNDVRAVGMTVEAVMLAGKPMIFVVNRVKPRSRLTGETAIALSQHGTVAPVQVGDRTDYAAAMVDGLTAQELGGGKAVEEMTELWQYLSSRLASQPARQPIRKPARKTT
jgi:chromosome partitioning protein